MLHVDSSDSYGGGDASFTFKQLQERLRINASDHHDPIVSCNESFNESRNKQFSIDMSVPKVVFCRSGDVEFLVSQQVSKYLSFLSVKTMSIGLREGDHWVIPNTRSSIFADKFLKLSEKRALMTLFKSVVTSNSSAIHSTALTGHIMDRDEKVSFEIAENVSGVQYLESLGITRPEIVGAIIHGMCMYPHPADILSGRDLVVRLRRFVSSLTAYEDGCPLLVPMYGNSDIPQSFARAAAVKGCLYILNCSLGQIQPELAADCKVISMLNSQSNGNSVLHATVALGDVDASAQVSLTILPASDLSSPPIYILTLPNNSGSGSGVSPPGCALVHFVQVFEDHGLTEQSTIAFDASVEKQICEKSVLFKARYQHACGEDPFGIQDAILSATKTFNSCMGMAEDTALPVSQDCVDDFHS